jgi:hypothetical protein
MVAGSQIRSRVDPRDVPPIKAARRLGLTLAEFEFHLPSLINRGFPPSDATTGFYDLKKIDQWMDDRGQLPSLTSPGIAEDARVTVGEKLKQYQRG